MLLICMHFERKFLILYYIYIQYVYIHVYVFIWVSVTSLNIDRSIVQRNVIIMKICQ